MPLTLRHWGEVGDRFSDEVCEILGSTSLGVAVLGTIFFSAFEHHLPTDALQLTAWACLAPLAAAFLLIFRLPMHARDEREQYVESAQPTAGG